MKKADKKALLKVLLSYNCLLLGIQTTQAVVNLSISQRVIFSWNFFLDIMT